MDKKILLFAIKELIKYSILGLIVFVIEYFQLNNLASASLGFVYFIVAYAIHTQIR
jgi:hypothetical protein